MGNVRVRGHDYRGKGYYFLTFGTLARRQWLSRIVDGRVVLEPAGELLMAAWRKIAADGRTLILTGFPDDEPEACRRTNCLKNNAWVRVIAAR